jgi:hypothetical protein
MPQDALAGVLSASTTGEGSEVNAQMQPLLTCCGGRV